MKVTLESKPLLAMIEQYLTDSGIDMTNRDFTVKFKGGRVNPPFAVITVETAAMQVPKAVTEAFYEAEEETTEDETVDTGDPQEEEDEEEADELFA